MIVNNWYRLTNIFYQDFRKGERGLDTGFDFINNSHIYKFPKSTKSTEKGRIEFSILFLEPGEYSEYIGNVPLYCYLNSNCAFSKTIWENAEAK